MKEKSKRPGCFAIVPAAGRGLRFGGRLPKQFAPVCGSTILTRTLRALWSTGLLDGMVVVVPAEAAGSDEILPGDMRGRDDILVTAGGMRRCDSVKAGLDRLPAGCELVLVHDGARPRVSAALVERVITGALQYGACVPVLPAAETLKQVDHNGKVEATLDRSRVRLAQTPQGFAREILAEAYRRVGTNDQGVDFTDDAALVEQAGYPVSTVAGEPGNIKLTRPSDLAGLGLMIPRVGLGYDVHRFGPGRKLLLGGVEVAHPQGLLGHSDGDVALHALIDALLGAAARGDIGRLFPDDDPAYLGADSIDLLQKTLSVIGRAGFTVCSADITIVAQAPRLKDYLPRMAERVSEALGLDPGQVGVKATTEEGLGFTGRQEGIAAHALAVLVRERTEDE
ncbi:MAG TPA: 2-C-methyl-D-erythritol 4-phosphate cytidylyltransferase [Myxococcota bacterium]|nr:2-C-methyl-D-erythritol 4-phosphate cytidylyltransferase [Myxococcota bacterium]